MTLNSTSQRTLRAGMVGAGMIFEETYLPFFRNVAKEGLFHRDTGLVEVSLAGIASRTGNRARNYLPQLDACQSIHGAEAISALLKLPIDAVCIATPDDRHFDAARAALSAGIHVLIEKPSVLRIQELDELNLMAQRRGVLAKVVYHKLLDPDHKKLRTHLVDGVLRHVNNGYCSLLEPKQISGQQFAEWIPGRNPATYVAVHYVKLIDFTFFHGTGARLLSIAATGQRGIVGAAQGNTWDSVQLRFTYRYPDQREATFDVHTSWVTPDNFPGYVEQEVQFRFDNGVWNAHQRKRGVEACVEGGALKVTPNHHYNGRFIEPWGERSQRGYGIEAIARFFEEVAHVEYGGPEAQRGERLEAMRALGYNDLAADRNVVAVTQALEAILRRHAEGAPGAYVEVTAGGGLEMRIPGSDAIDDLYPEFDP